MGNAALVIGVNAYGGGMDLAGCVNDALDWAQVLDGAGYRVTELLDADATGQNILDALLGHVSGTRPGDTVIVTFSGHGTWVPDLDGDEGDGRDEAICPVDVGSYGAITDDQLFDVFIDRHPQARVVFLSDSCHSGTVARFAPPLGLSDSSPTATVERRLVRFMPPAVFLSEAKARAAARLPVLPASRARHTALLMAGCQDWEYAYDAWFDGRANGAFTRVAVDALGDLERMPRPKYREWWLKIRERLPSQDYPQTPALVGAPHQRQWQVFE